ncbi:MAG: hypothetical protein JSS75_02110 [Bacteroidetes bacterium]|nr:hypothetical protein [Bacteroidota bacterium]
MQKYLLSVVIAVIFGSVLAVSLDSCKHDAFHPLSPADTTGKHDTTGNGAKDTTGTGGKDTTGTGGGTNWGFDTSLYVPSHPCSSDSVYFTNDILPLIGSNCAMSGCHDGGQGEGRFALNSYPSIKAYVRTSSPTTSKLYTVLSARGEDAMPRNGTPFTAAQKAQVLKWIQQGAKNNSCDGNCDTVATYSQTIVPIMQNACLGCHAAPATNGGGFVLETYSQLQVYVKNGKLMGDLTKAPGYNAMPQQGAISPCDLNAFKIWAMHGAPNN